MAKTKKVAEEATINVVYTASGERLSENASTETVSIRQFSTEPARISIEQGATLNLGNYESARVTVGLTLPCYVEEIDFASAYVDQWVTAKMESEILKIKEFIKERDKF